MKKLLFLFLFLPVIIFAQEDWQYIGTTVNNDKYYIKDIEQLSNEDNVSVWVKILKSDNKKDIKKGGVFKASDVCLNKWLFNCQEKSSTTQTMVIYDKKGKMRNSSNGPFEKVYIIPGSMVEKVFNSVCKK